MKAQICAMTAMLVVLASCQNTPRLTLFKPHSTPVDRRIAFNDCRSSSPQTDGNSAARAGYVKRCMESKGYTMLENIPVCATPEKRRIALREPQPRKASQLKCASGVALDE